MNKLAGCRFVTEPTVDPFTLLVNSCDSFEDCWTPFFTLLDRYWPEKRPRILLNTEVKDWSFPGVTIETTRVQRGVDRRLSWSECLTAALDRVETPLVLYMQEDYFLEVPVDTRRVAQCARLMMNDPAIKHISLTHFGAGGPMLPDARDALVQIGSKATYRMSTQAGLWRTETLKSYLLPWESGWMFELMGTVRSWRRKELFLALDRMSTSPALTYQNTGVVKGQWSSFVPALFQKEGIHMDFSKRGFYNEKSPTFKRQLRLLAGLIRRPLLAAKSVMS
jgi:hypothetical protein